MQDNKTLSRQQTHASVRNSVTTKEIIIATENEKNHRSMSQHSKECCNKVEELEAENFVATEDQEEIIEDCHDSVSYVAAFQTYVAT